MMSWVEGAIWIYFALNLIAFIAFLWDKRGATKHRGRISEQRLLLFSLFGPFGALISMRLFHHKTRKRKFLLVPVFLIIHLVIFISWAFRSI